MKIKIKTIIILSCGILLTAQYAGAWSSVIRLTWNGGASDEPCIAVDSNDYIHVVWMDDSPGRMEIFYKKSTDGGSSWSAPHRLTWLSGASEFPVIVVDPSDNLHVVWSDGTPGFSEIYYKLSTDGGSSWGGARRLTWTQGRSAFPALAVGSGSRLHLVWADNSPGNYEIYYKQSTDGGVTWSAPHRLTWNSGDSDNPFLLMGSGNNVHIFWNDYTPFNWEIYSKTSTDNGSTWGSPKRLTWNSGTSGMPAAANKGGHLYLTWHDQSPGNFEIFAKASMNGGASWSPPTRLTWNSGTSGHPTIGVDSNETCHVIWHDDSVGNAELNYKKSYDNTVTWSSLTRITWNSGASLVPCLAIDSANNIHVVWTDFTPGNWEIFYKWQTGTIIK